MSNEDGNMEKDYKPIGYNSVSPYLIVEGTFAKAVELGCEVVEEPVRKEGDPDMRGSFKDFNGNTWAVGTQQG